MFMGFGLMAGLVASSAGGAVWMSCRRCQGADCRVYPCGGVMNYGNED